LLSIDRSPYEPTRFLTYWLVHLCFGALAVLVIQHATTRRRLDGLVDVILLQATFIAGYGIWAWFAGDYGVRDKDMPSLFRTGSTFADPLRLAFFLTTVFPVAIYRTAAARTAITRVAGLVCIATLLVTTVLTSSRGPALSTVIAGAVAACFVSSTILRLSFVAGPALLWVMGLAMASFNDVSMLHRFANDDIGTLNGRTRLWQAVFEHFEASRLLGEGMGAADALLRKLNVTHEDGGFIGRTPHNLFVSTLYDHGIVGVVLLLVLFIALAWGLWRLSPVSADHRVFRAAAIATLVNVAILSFEMPDFWKQSIGPYIWVILALPFAYVWDRDHPALRGAHREHQHCS
jgi:O-antigen ligase